MQKIILLALIVVFSSKSFSDVGLGISIESDEGQLYVPFEISDQFRIEPTFIYRMNDSVEGYGGSKTEYKEAGVGAIVKNHLATDVLFYYGFRLSYLSSKIEFRSSSGNSKMDGYSVSPILGFEYYPITRLSIGAEAGLVYATLDGRESSFFDEGDSNEKYTYTNTSLILRFFIK